MKILLMVDYFSAKSIGGAGIVSFDEAVALQKRGHSVKVITTTENLAEAGEHVEGGIPVHRLYSKYPHEWRGYVSVYNFHLVPQVKQLIVEFKPDVVHAHSIHTHISYVSLKVAKRSGAKVFLTVHDVMPVHYGKFTEFIDLNDRSIPARFNYRIHWWQLFKTFRWRFNPLRNVFIRHYLRSVDKIIAVSAALKQVLNDNGIGNVDVIHNGIDVASWQVSDATVAEFKKRHGLEGKKVILFSGWITGAKGGDQLLAAFKIIAEKIPNAIIVAAGRTDLYYVSMKEQAAKCGLSDRIIFPGWVAGPDLIASYEAADLIAFPSICFDTFGMVNLEGMCSRKPVIATCFGGASEVVEHGKTGYIINPYDTETFAARLTELLSDPKKAAVFGDTGYERAVRFFNKEDKLDELLSLYLN